MRLTSKHNYITSFIKVLCSGKYCQILKTSSKRNAKT